MAAELTVRDLGLRFGGISVLDGVSFSVDAGTIFGLVGPNGAGKTSLFNCVSGHYRPSSGSIRIGDVDVQSKPAWRLAGLGLARTFQHPALQLQATVLENVLLGAHGSLRGGPVAWSLRMPWTASGEKRARARALELLARFGLQDSAERPAGDLSSGIHKSIELCRALMSAPALLLLDEPAAGLSHTEVEDFIGSIRQVREDFDLTIVVVEHHMGLISAVTDRVLVLDHGRPLMEGTAREVQSDPRVVEAYLGQGVTEGEPA